MNNPIDATDLDEYLNFNITTEDRQNYKRLDQFLTDKIPNHSRTFLKNLFLTDNITLSEDSPVQDYNLELKKMPPVGAIVQVMVPPMLDAEAQPENIPLEILYEDEHLVFVNKPAGLVTHPAPGNYTGTLVNAILYHCKDIKGVGNQKRPGIVHRLDKGTSGVMVVAKTQACHEGLVLLFSSHNLERNYQAIIMGTKFTPHGIIKSTIGRDKNNRLKMKANVTKGKNAITIFKVLETFKNHSHLEFKLETGRTHQIRVHASDILRKPLLGDSLYGCPRDQLLRLGPLYQELIGEYPHPFLHAKSLSLIHPITKEKLHFEVPAPKIFQDVLTLSRTGQ
jgi:23S rRNA pseudouridine1911/1915/1917 synthase